MLLFEHAQNSPEVTKPSQLTMKKKTTTTTTKKKNKKKKKTTTTTTTTKCLLLLLAPAVPTVNQQPLLMSTPFLKQWGERR